LRERNCLAEIGFGQFCLTLFQPQFATDPQNLGLVNEFLGIRPKRPLDRFKRFGGGALPPQCGRQDGSNKADAQAHAEFEHLGYPAAHQLDILVIASWPAERLEFDFQPLRASAFPIALVETARIYRELAREFHPDCNPQGAPTMRPLNQMMDAIRSDVEARQ
jgi:hypothetical protein